MSNISQITTPNGNTYDIAAKTARGIVRATMESTSTSIAFVITADGITSLYDGATIVVKNTIVASASGCTMNVNGLGAKTIWTSQSNTACTTHWAKNTTYIFIYDSTNERWELQQGRDTDNNDTSTIRPYYTHFKSGSNGIKQCSLFAKLRDSDTYSSFTSTHGTGTKTYITDTSFDLSDIYYFNSSSNLAANTNTGNNTVTNCGNLVDMRYTLNDITTKASTSKLTANKPVYLIFDKDCKLYYPYFTQDPTVDCVYEDPEDWGMVRYAVLLGYMYDTYRMDLLVNNPIYEADEYGWNMSSMSEYPIFKPFNNTHMTTQKYTTSDEDFQVLLASTTGTDDVVGNVYKQNKLKFNPSTGKLSALGNITTDSSLVGNSINLKMGNDIANIMHMGSNAEVVLSDDFKEALYGNTDVNIESGSSIDVTTDSKSILNKLIVDISNPSGGTGFNNCLVTKNPNMPTNLFDKVLTPSNISTNHNITYNWNGNHLIASGTADGNAWIADFPILPNTNPATNDIFTLSYCGKFEGLTRDGVDSHKIFGLYQCEVLSEGETDTGYYVTVKVLSAGAGSRLRLTGYVKSGVSVDIDAYFMLESGSVYHDYIPFEYNKYRTYFNSFNFTPYANSTSSGLTIKSSGNRFVLSGTATASWSNLTGVITVSYPAGSTLTLAIDHPLPCNVYIHVWYTDNHTADFIINAGQLSVTNTLTKAIKQIRLDTSGMSNNTQYYSDFAVYLIRHVYSGKLDVLSGKLTVNAYETGDLVNPEIYYLEPKQIVTEVGDNTFSANTGDILECEYRPLIIPETTLYDSINNMYPVGSVYQSTSFLNPQNWIDGTVWIQIGTQTIGTETVYFFKRIN